MNDNLDFLKKIKPKQKREELRSFCKDNNITLIGVEAYFDIGEKKYRLSRYNVEINSTSSGMRVKSKHVVKKETYIKINSIYDIPRIYTDLIQGIELDECGNRIEEKKVETIETKEYDESKDYGVEETQLQIEELHSKDNEDSHSESIEEEIQNSNLQYDSIKNSRQRQNDMVNMLLNSNKRKRR